MPSKKESKKEPYASKASSSKKKPKDGDEDGSKKRKQKKKKDPNAPKRAMSSFMYFSQTEREVRFLMCLEFACPEEARWVIDSGRRWFMGVSLKRGVGGWGRGGWVSRGLHTLPPSRH